LRVIRDILIPIVAAIAIFFLLQVTIGSFKVYGSSMMPNIHDGEYIIVSKASYFFNNPDHGEVVVLHSPRNPKSDLIKRIIATPGDIIEINNSTVYINGTPLNEPYIAEPPKYIYPEHEIPANNYFVLGDNRNNSSDSHKGWTVPRENIVGKAWVVYWPPQNWRLIEKYAFDSTGQLAELDKLSLTMTTPCPTK